MDDHRSDTRLDGEGTALVDSFQRRIDYLRISVTDQCNLNCIYCKPQSWLRLFSRQEVLSADEIARMVGIACRFGLRKVRITGGEPLMRTDIVPLIYRLKRIGIRDLSLSTNGTMLAALAGPLKDAGLDRVNISLDTLVPERYRTITRGGDINRVWEAIACAERAGLSPIKINVVPMRGVNDDEIQTFALLTFNKDYHIRFIEYMPTGKNAWTHEACVTKEEMMEHVSALGKLVPLKFNGSGPARNYRIEGARGVIGFISPVSDHFCGWCNRLRLTAIGKLRPCLFSSREIDVKTPMRAGATDDEIARLLEKAVMSKPAGHQLYGEMKVPSDLISMSRIGG